MRNAAQRADDLDRADISLAVNRLRGELHIYRDGMSAEAITRRIVNLCDVALAGIRERAGDAIRDRNQIKASAVETNKQAAKSVTRANQRTSDAVEERKRLELALEDAKVRLAAIRRMAAEEFLRLDTDSNLHVRRSVLRLIKNRAEGIAND